MKVVILAGGEGVRLRPLTYSIPKPLIPVGEKPILEEIISRLRDFGFDDIILTVGYRAELIETYFQDGSAFGVSIRYVREVKPLGTAGALSLVRRAMAPMEPLLVMNGDVLTRLNFGAIRHWHQEGGYDMTVAVRVYETRLPYGIIQTEGARVTGIIEKPTAQHDVNAGIYVLAPSALEMVPESTFFDMPDLATRLISEGRSVGAYRFEEAWLAVDRIDQLEEANRLITDRAT